MAPPTESLRIQQRDLQGVKAARSFVNQQLTAWGLTDMADSLQLIVSEIVPNALIHAGSDVDVRLRAFDDHVRSMYGIPAATRLCRHRWRTARKATRRRSTAAVC